MSYNGIGLSTVRGSGTNGYVQRNLSTIRRIKEKAGIKTEEELDDLDYRSQKKPNLELLDHNRKRKVEVKCMELQDLMEEQGYDEEEIQKKVDSYRQMLLENQDCLPGKEDSSGRPIITETHQIADMKEKENESLREAFGIRKDYVKGSAFMNSNDKSSSKQEEPNNFKLVRSPSKSPSPRREPEKRRTLEKRHRRRSSSASRSDAEEKRKKKSSKKKHESVKQRNRSDSDREYSRHHQAKKAKRKKEKHSKKKHHEKKSKHSKSRKKSSRSRPDSNSDSSSDSD